MRNPEWLEETGERAKAFRRLETPSGIKNLNFKTKKKFLMWAIFQLTIEFVIILLLFYCFMFLVFWPQVRWDISFPTRIEFPRPALEGKVLTTGLPEKSQQSLLQFQFRVKCEAISFSKAETLKGKFVIIPPPTCFWLTLGQGKLGLVQMLVHQIRWGLGHLPSPHFKFTVFLFKIVILVLCTKHKIYPFSPWVDNSATVITFTLLCNCQQHPCPELSQS